MLQVILGSIGVFPIFNNLVSRKQQVLERKMHPNLYVIQFYVVVVCHLVKQSVKAPGLLVTPLQMVFSSLDDLLASVEIILHDVNFLYSTFCYQLHNSSVCPSKGSYVRDSIIIKQSGIQILRKKEWSMEWSIEWSIFFEDTDSLIK